MPHIVVGKIASRALQVLSLTSLIIGPLMATARAADENPKTIYGFTMSDIDGKAIPLEKYKGKVLLIVNVASQCGNTPQYAGLEELYRKYKDRGLVVLGFPANNFGQQEPGSNEEIKTFCQTNYNVTFDMFSKISVKGPDQHPLYRFITSPETDPEYSGDVRWNFQKYLVDRNGVIVGKFLPKVAPLSKEVTSAVEKALEQK
jgi:glutathione peroxidase